MTYLLAGEKELLVHRINSELLKRMFYVVEGILLLSAWNAF